MWAMISWPFSSFTRNMVFGRVSETVPSNSMTSSFAMCFLVLRGAWFDKLTMSQARRGSGGAGKVGHSGTRAGCGAKEPQSASDAAASSPKRAVHASGGSCKDVNAWTLRRNSPRGHACAPNRNRCCLLYTSDAADERSSVDLGGRRIIKKKKK